MTDVADYVNANREALDRLRALVTRLTDDDLAQAVEGGWTVAATLAHLAFWDRRQQFALERWEHTGAEPGGQDPDAVNDALLPLAAALDPHTAARLALSAAESADAAAGQVPAAFADQVQRAGFPYLLRRSEHRLNHIEQIESTFAR